MSARVVSVASSPDHGFSKQTQPSIQLLAGLGVAGDAHAGETVKHRSRVKANPSLPNLRQVHLIDVELLEAVAASGLDIQPGMLGENITTRGAGLLSLPRGACLLLGPEAVIEITGLRNPCMQIEAFRTGLLEQVIERPPGGGLVRKAGVMAIVLKGGEVLPGDAIAIQLPPQPHVALEPV